VSRKRIVIITIGVMLALFMSAIESTVVATAMPTIIAQLGGLATYSWVFSAYMLASTTTVPIYGKLSDLYGRRPVFLFAMSLFLVGSFLSGQSRDMTQLIIFRTIQGLGAGGLLPLAFIMIGDLFSFEQRAHMQGLFSGVWGVASVLGPLLGGFLVDHISWHWVFYVNIGPGLIAMFFVGLAWQAGGQRARGRAAAPLPIDFAGAAVMSAAVVALLLGLFDLGTPTGWALLVLALVLFVALLYIERRAADPLLPLSLFNDRLFAVACAHGVMVGWAMFGSTSFVPLFAQAVLGASPTVAGMILTPQTLTWTAASIIGSRLLLRLGYRSMSVAGMVVLAGGFALLTQINIHTSLWSLAAIFAIMGIGMGVSMPAFLIAVQTSVRREVLGAATATLQFTRSIGGAIGVSVMGVVLSARLAAGLLAAGVDPSVAQLSDLTNPLATTGAATERVADALRLALAGGIRDVFVVALIAAIVGLIATAMAPRERLTEGSAARQPIHTTDPGPIGGAEGTEPAVSVAGE
jgi:EmrB/QacA subfamily drug resistance transporter